MLNCQTFFGLLNSYGVKFFTGVPDSLLKDFCAYAQDHLRKEHHVIAANEGAAVALACGHYLATGQIPLVYMQNSGQGNAVNPLVSLADPDVYAIPLLLLIGWRGEPGKRDEPQHLKQGKITLSLLNTLEIPYQILPNADHDAEKCLKQILNTAETGRLPVALVVKKGTFKEYRPKKSQRCPLELSREQAIRLIAEQLEDDDIVVSTTGKISRELYEYREAIACDHSKDFLTVGSMGHASQIALGIALAKPARQVFCFDGDGAAIMHMGSMATIGWQKPDNFRHIIFNNGCHESVGGQPTAGLAISFPDIAKACGYRLAVTAQTAAEISERMPLLKAVPGPSLLEVKVRRGARADLGRPTTSPKQNKAAFMEFLAK